jgi:hypothetical protein
MSKPNFISSFYDLKAELPFEEIAALDRLEHVTAVEVRTFARDFLRLVPPERIYPLHGLPVDFTKRETPFALTSRKVWMPHPSIVAKLRGSARSLISYIGICADSGVSDAKSQNVSCAEATCGISLFGSGFTA